MNISSSLKKIKYNPTSSYSIPINLQIEILLRVKIKYYCQAVIVNMVYAIL